MKLAVYFFSISLLLFMPQGSHAQSGSLHEIAGVYSGNLPCGNCPDIQYRLSLFRDGSYEESVRYPATSSTPVMTGGTYTITDNSILKLSGRSYSMGVFRIMPGALQMLDANGHDIPAAQSERYLLNKLSRDTQFTLDEPEKIITAPLKRKKYHQGITFYAMGNEPSWSLDIAKGKSIVFKALDGTELQSPYTESVKAMDANVKMFQVQTESGTLRIQLIRQPCHDPMSGEEFGYQVSMDVKLNNENEIRHYEGCGNYVPDFGLEGSWTLKASAADETEFNKSMQRLPFLVFNIDSSRYAGYTGCNRITGKLQMTEPGFIRFEEGAMTMMACPGQHKEQDFLKTLQQTIQYTLKQDELELGNPGQSLMVLKRTSPELPAGYRVIDIWVLESMDGKAVDPNNFRRELPRLEINSALMLTGFTGCNNFNGTVTADDKNISFSAITMTRMACPDAAQEKRFTDALQAASTYVVSDNRLTLQNETGILLVFRKVD